MTEKTEKPENEEATVTEKPPMSKTVEPKTEAKAKPKPEGQGEGKTGGQMEKTAAETVSLEREVLLDVETYEEAEAVLSEHPELIAPARVVFGSVVPTTGQNAIRRPGG